MAWVAKALASAIKSKITPLYGIEGADYQKAYADAILEYVLANTTVSYAWAGANPSGSPDPVALVSCTISGGTPFSGPMGSLVEFYTRIATMIKSITITPGGGFTIAPTVFNPAYTITPSIDKSCDTFEKALDALASDICGSFSLLINPSPASGVHGAFTGATVSMTVA